MFLGLCDIPSALREILSNSFTLLRNASQGQRLSNRQTAINYAISSTRRKESFTMYKLNYQRPSSWVHAAVVVASRINIYLPTCDIHADACSKHMGARVEQNDIRFSRYRRAQITMHTWYLWYFAFDMCVCDRIAYTRMVVADR